jgi:mycofactocin glycosyltransferase
MQPSVSFVIPTFRRPDALRATLEAVLAVDYPSELCEVIVVDNAGDGTTAAVTQGLSGSAIPVRRVVETAGGSARARNHGARIAGGELLILLDDDILVEASHVNRHLATRERYGDGLTGGNWQFHPTTLAALDQTLFGRYRMALDHRFRGTPDGRRLDHDRWDVDALAACNLVISRRLFWELGGFDEEFPFAGVEDREFSMRASASGCRLIRDDAVRLLHNDQTITLEQFCVREERSAQTIAVLCRKHPDAERGRTFAAVNGPIAAGDPPAEIAKKLVKRLLATPPLIRLLHATVHAVEKLGLGERMMGRLYTGVVGVHIFRGFRDAR